MGDDSDEGYEDDGAPGGPVWVESREEVTAVSINSQDVLPLLPLPPLPLSDTLMALSVSCLSSSV